MATWPTTLPSPHYDGYGIQPKDQSIRTDMEAGNARVRRSTFSRVDEVDVWWVMSDAQMAIFRTWFEDGATGAAGGSAWFTVLLNTGSGAVVSTSARFIGAYQFALLSINQWKVSAKLETRT